MSNNEKLTYKDSGVDIKAGYKSVDLIKKHVKSTFTEGVLSDIGGFGGMFSLGKDSMEEPVLVSGTDGVGTKLMIAFKTNKHDTIGQDAVAMCVNDVVCQGARPLFFLDYIATGKIKPEKISQIVKGIADGCKKSKAALIGGETAEMPGLYSEGEYDIAGFCVGIVDKKDIITGDKIIEGDVIIGIPSSGLHSNGFSLVRKLFFEIKKWDIDRYISEFGSTLGEELLKPTEIYVDVILEVLKKYKVKGLSHITGGGFYENIPRILPENLSAEINLNKINTPPIFKVIQREGNIEKEEMYSTFNMGIGMVIVVDPKNENGIKEVIKRKGYKPVTLGKISKGKEKVVLWED
ncbi:MAG TPA: phosphoribosylformylglycinamidine cyclo-ligase [Clostridiales bacterium]|nr:phosphoribosylformylglycinamidine cyclo-ligase [Clostridiales bacterium]